MSQIHIDTNRIEELYQVLYEEKDSADAMINVLIRFKQNLEEQGFNQNSLHQVHYYLDTLINLFEILSSNIVTLQENATEISEQFTKTDQALAASLYGRTGGATSYKAYEVQQLQENNRI